VIAIRVSPDLIDREPGITAGFPAFGELAYRVAVKGPGAAQTKNRTEKDLSQHLRSLLFMNAVNEQENWQES